jgi:neutral amino acid transport system permease protein
VPTSPTTTFRLSVILALATLVAILFAAPVAAQDAEPEGTVQSVGGTLTSGGDPVPGVTMRVTTEDGTLIEEAASGEDGTWRVEVPEPGRYTVTIDTETLPEGVSLANPDRTSATPNIRPGGQQTVLFSLDERVVATVSRLDRISNLVAEGVKFGLMIALAALGLSVVFGVTGLVNFAHGELLAFGGLVTFWLERGYGPFPEMPLIVAALLAMVFTGLFAASWELAIFGPVRRRKSGEIAAMVISIGLALIIRHLYLIFAGSRPTFYLDYRLQSTFRVGPVALTPKAWTTIIVATIVLLAVGWALRNTRVGTATRAVSVNRDLAESSGIDVRKVVLTTWIVGGALAGLSGALFGLAESVRWDMGNDVLLLVFAAVVLGGLGTAYGAMLGGLVVGIVTQLSTYWFPTDLKLMFALVVLIGVLLVRPMGILGVRERFG